LEGGRSFATEKEPLLRRKVVSLEKVDSAKAEKRKYEEKKKNRRFMKGKVHFDTLGGGWSPGWDRRKNNAMNIGKGRCVYFGKNSLRKQEPVVTARMAPEGIPGDKASSADNRISRKVALAISRSILRRLHLGRLDSETWERKVQLAGREKLCLWENGRSGKG